MLIKSYRQCFVSGWLLFAMAALCLVGCGRCVDPGASCSGILTLKNLGNVPWAYVYVQAAGGEGAFFEYRPTQPIGEGESVTFKCVPADCDFLVHADDERGFAMLNFPTGCDKEWLVEIYSCALFLPGEEPSCGSNPVAEVTRISKTQEMSKVWAIEQSDIYPDLTCPFVDMTALLDE